MMRQSRSLLIAFLSLLALEGLAVLVRLASIPADPKNSLLLGYSLSRLVMMAVALGVSLLAVLVGTVFWRSPKRYARAAGWLEGGSAARLVSGLLALLAAGSWLALVLLRSDLERNLSAYQRLQPVLLLGFLAGLQGLLLLPVWRFGLRRVDGIAAVKRASLAVFAAFALLFTLVALTGFGVTPDLYAWGAPGVPLLAWQVLMAGLLGCWAYLLFPALRASAAGVPRYLNILLCVAVWALAVGVWLSQPLQPSYFNPQMRAPNAEYYPYSDAGYYDYIAEGLISGGGYMGGRGVTRPLYILFLALLHLVGGHAYSTMVVLQTLVLALFPVAIYLLGSVFHSRAAGLLAAILAILREFNAYAATSLTEVSHAKMLLSDLPATLGMVLLVLTCVHWLQHPEKRWMPVVVGGTAGLLALLRAQSLLVMPFIFVLALFVYRGKFLRLVEAGVLVGVGAALALVPWMGRNAISGNGFAIDQPGNQVIIFAQRYSFELQRWPPREDGESEAQYSSRMLGIAREFAVQNPAYTAGFIGAHFLNNIIDTAVVLPVRTGFDDFRDNWTLTSFFWEKLFTPLGAGGAVLMLLNLGLISIGIGASWVRWRAVGLLPLIIVPAYSLSNAIARNSGWRYILPVDWVGYFYFAIGVLTLFAWLLVALGKIHTESGAKTPAASFQGPFPWRRTVGLGLLFLAVGLSVPLAERLFPARYPAVAPAQLAGQMLASPVLQASGADLDALRDFLASDSAVLLRGRALYPRFYYSGQGELGTGWRAYSVREGSRLGFLVLQDGGVRQVLLRQEISPKVFPHAADVLVAGCEDDEGTIQALFALLPGQTERVYFRDLDGPFACPLP